MMMFGLLILPMVLARDRTVERDNYVVTINFGTLKSINVNGQLPDILDLSDLNIDFVEEDVFANFSNLKALNLSMNNLSFFPEFTFANLTNLETLNLSTNYIKRINFSHGLKNLKTLDVTDTRLMFEAGKFYGLPKSTNILTHEPIYGGISVAMFENPSNITWRRRKEMDEIGGNYIPVSNAAREPKVKVCVEDGHLKSLDAFNENETLSDDCRKLNHYYDRLELTGLGIRTFDSKWYRLQEHDEKAPRKTLSFCDNKIDQLSKELLNDLPAEIRIVDLTGNKIERLQRGTIENHNPIVGINLSNNTISEIEDGALENLNITGDLVLDDNKLTNTKFLDSLPSKIAAVTLIGNRITEIAAGNFSRFKNFRFLDIGKNNIKEAKANCLRDFWSLERLDLPENGLRKIEPGFFRDLKSLKIINLENNDISVLDEGVFAGLESITSIILASNKLTEISSNMFSTLPISLKALYLEDNLIETLRTGTFVNVPTETLSLNYNKISTIEKGCFNLPKLESLYIMKNSLTEMDGDWFEGLPNLGVLSLSQNFITTIKKRAGKHLNSINTLQLSYNPIKRLENGILFGLSKTGDTYIELFDVPLESIQAGVFDDV